MSIPAMGMSSGPGYENSGPQSSMGARATITELRSTRAVVMVTGVPVMYELDQSTT